MSDKKRWKPQDEALLRQLWRARCPIKDMSAMLNRTADALWAKSRRLRLSYARHAPRRGVPPLEPTREQWNILRKYYPECSNKTIALVLGVSTGTLHRWKTEYNLKKTSEYLKSCRSKRRNVKQEK